MAAQFMLQLHVEPPHHLSAPLTFVKPAAAGDRGIVKQVDGKRQALAALSHR